jgi:Mrp family chromosome partitioning ATPase
MDLNQSVLLIDMDLIHPNVNTCFNMEVKNGLSDYINSNIPLSELLVNPGIERLLVLPGKGRVTRSSEMLASPKISNLVSQIKRDNPSAMIIFDLPPVMAADDVLISSRYYDALLLVIAEGGNKPDEVTQALKMLSGIPLLGTVLNKSEHLPNYQRYSYANKK